MSASPVLRVDRVSKSFGAQDVLRDFSLSVEPGEYVALVGANGAGKTTLFKLLLDLLKPDTGTIRIFEQSQREAAARRQLAYLPERFDPPGFATGRELLLHLCGLHGRRFVEAEAGALCHRLELDSAALRQRLRRYSKGMMQKLGLIACLLVEAPLLLLDEPMSGLDPKARALFKRELSALQARGQTLFLSTHLLQDVEALCDRIAVLHAGRLVFTGTCTKFRETYDSDDLEQAYLACLDHVA
jgi:ABC-2 type transport system ATP-binding protein